MYTAFLKNGQTLSVAEIGDIDFLPSEQRINVLFIHSKQIENGFIWNDEYKFWCIMYEGKIKLYFSVFFGQWRDMKRPASVAPVANIIPQQASSHYNTIEKVVAELGQNPIRMVIIDFIRTQYDLTNEKDQNYVANIFGHYHIDPDEYFDKDGDWLKPF